MDVSTILLRMVLSLPGYHQPKKKCLQATSRVATSAVHLSAAQFEQRYADNIIDALDNENQRTILDTYPTSKRMRPFLGL